VKKGLEVHFVSNIFGLSFEHMQIVTFLPYLLKWSHKFYKKY